MKENTKGAGAFGAVAVRNNKIVAETFNTVGRDNDCTQHAELAVIQKACRALGQYLGELFPEHELRALYDVFMSHQVG